MKKNHESTSSHPAVASAEMEEKAQSTIKKYAALSLTAGLVPVPFLDLAALAAIQVKLIQEIAKLHGQEFSEHVGKPVITASLTALAGNPVSRVGASLLRFVPVVGSVLGAVSFYGYAAASTYAIGNLFHQHFLNGGTLEDFDAHKAKQAYNDLVAKYKSEHKAKPSEEPAAA